MVITSAKRLTSVLSWPDASAATICPLTGRAKSRLMTILAMDWENLSELQRQCPPVFRHKLHLLMRYASEYDAAVIPDPYYGGTNGFNLVLDYCEDACQGLLEIVKRRVSMYAPAPQPQKGEAEH